MNIQTINVGAIANDGTGDHLRDAFIKVNSNFTEVSHSDIIPETGDRTLQLTDNYNIITVDSAVASIITVPPSIFLLGHL